MDTQNKKKIFISDLHMGDERSLSCSFYRPFGWMLCSLPLAAAFLDSLKKDPAVEEVIILGDLFDGWIIPNDLHPTVDSYYDNVCRAEPNQPLVNSLKALAADPGTGLSYLPGNHDMNTPKSFMEQTFPGINWVGPEGVGWQVYTDGHLKAEHGHQYSLFNSPNAWTPKPPPLPQFLPLGYYISRLVAHKASVTGNVQDALSILIKLVKQITDGPETAYFMESLLVSVAQDAKLNRNSKINMGDADQPTVEMAGKMFKDIYSNWNKNTPTRIRALGALLADEMLVDCIYKQYYRRNSGVKIVVCGHTHKPLLRVPLLLDEEIEKDLLGDEEGGPVKFIYANCGTWIDSAPRCTYVETEENTGENRHYARVKSYSADGPDQVLYQRYVSLK